MIYRSADVSVSTFDSSPVNFPRKREPWTDRGRRHAEGGFNFRSGKSVLPAASYFSPRYARYPTLHRASTGNSSPSLSYIRAISKDEG